MANDGLLGGSVTLGWLLSQISYPLADGWSRVSSVVGNVASASQIPAYSPGGREKPWSLQGLMCSRLNSNTLAFPPQSISQIRA